MIQLIKRNPWLTTVLVLVGIYVAYFSYFTILRYQTLYASYYDLGIMHQTVFNTYKAITNGDMSRFLELTNPVGIDQIKRMAIHNDILLAFLAPFYFIHVGPETLLIIQSLVIALGGFVIYKLTLLIFANRHYRYVYALLFTFLYLLYPPLQRVNQYEFHAVALASTFLLCMFYFWKVKRYSLSFLFFLLSMLSKEQVALTTFFFGCYILFTQWREHGVSFFSVKKNHFAYLIMGVSVIWFLVSMLYIIPTFRGSNHFALGYYGDFGDSPISVLVGILKNPLTISKYLFHIDTVRYFFFLLGPLGFMSLFSPIQLLIALPEFGINLLSNSWHMRNIFFHYTAVIQPFIFIATIYGTKVFIDKYHQKLKRPVLFVGLYLFIMGILFSYFKGPLPFAREQEIHPFKYPQEAYRDIGQWVHILQSDKIKVSTTGQLAPHFTSRRYFYTFSEHYPLADYIVLRTGEIYNYPEKEVLIPIYENLQNDVRFQRIYQKGELEVYKKVN